MSADSKSRFLWAVEQGGWDNEDIRIESHSEDYQTITITDRLTVKQGETGQLRIEFLKNENGKFAFEGASLHALREDAEGGKQRSYWSSYRSDKSFRLMDAIAWVTGPQSPTGRQARQEQERVQAERRQALEDEFVRTPDTPFRAQLRETLEKERAAAEETKKSYRKRVEESKDLAFHASAVQYIMEAEETIHLCDRALLTEGIEKDKICWLEEGLARRCGSILDDVLRSAGNEHNSTSQMHNIADSAKLRAQAQFVKTYHPQVGTIRDWPEEMQARRWGWYS